jgi:hypothetical protein
MTRHDRGGRLFSRRILTRLPAEALAPRGARIDGLSALGRRRFASRSFEHLPCIA